MAYLKWVSDPNDDNTRLLYIGLDGAVEVAHLEYAGDRGWEVDLGTGAPKVVRDPVGFVMKHLSKEGFVPYGAIKKAIKVTAGAVVDNIVPGKWKRLKPHSESDMSVAYQWAGPKKTYYRVAGALADAVAPGSWGGHKGGALDVADAIFADFDMPRVSEWEFAYHGGRSKEKNWNGTGSKATFEEALHDLELDEVDPFEFDLVISEGPWGNTHMSGPHGEPIERVPPLFFVGVRVRG